MNKENKLGDAAWMLTSALFFTVVDILVEVFGPRFSVWQIGFGRFIFGLVSLPLLARALRMDLFGEERVLLLLRGVSGTLSFLCFIVAIQRLPLSQAVVLFYLFPAWAALLSPWVAAEKTPLQDWPFVAGAFGGVGLILWPQPGTVDLDWGHLFGLAAAFFAGVTVSLIRRLRARNNVITLYFYFCLVGVAVTVTSLTLQGGPVVPDARGAMVLLLVGVLAGTAQLCMNQGFKTLNAAKGAVLLMSEAVFASSFGIILLGEPMTWRLAGGAVLILGCGIGLSLRSRAKPPPG